MSSISKDEKKMLIELICNEQTHMIIKDHTKYDSEIATQAHSFRCGLVAQQYKLFNKLNYIFNFTMKIFTYAV